jgi:hypothetical protein
MTTETVALDGDKTAHDLPDRSLRLVGAAGVAAVIGFAAYVAVGGIAGGVDPLTASRQALAHSLAQRSGSGLALVVLAVSALSYVPMVVFLAGMQQAAARLDDSGLARSIVGVASGLFLAGAIASDGFNLAVSVAQHAVPSFQPAPSLATAMSAGWLVCLVEAQVALGIVSATVGIAVLARRRKASTVPPSWIGWWGVFGAVALIPLLCAPNVLPVFVASNLVRLSWILAVGVFLLRRHRATGAGQ